MPQVFLIRPHHRLLPPAPCYRSPYGAPLPIPTAAPTSSEKQGSSICNSSCCHRACKVWPNIGSGNCPPRPRAEDRQCASAAGTRRDAPPGSGARAEPRPSHRAFARRPDQFSRTANLLWLSKSSERFGSYSLRYPLTLANPKGCFGWWGVRVRSR